MPGFSGMNSPNGEREATFILDLRGWRPERVKNSQILDLWPLMKGRVGNGVCKPRKGNEEICFIIRIFLPNCQKWRFYLVTGFPFAWCKDKKPNADEALKILHWDGTWGGFEQDRQPAFTVHAYMRYGADYWKAYMPD